MTFGHLLLLASCWDHTSEDSADDAEPAECGPEGESQEQCPVDECAAACSTVESGTGCCIDAHGWGLDGDDLDRLLAACSGDDCDPGIYISAEAALCVAQVNGLEPGIGWCGGYFDFVDGGAWYIRNTTYEGCPGDPTLEGDGLRIDARSGEVTGEFQNSSYVECD